MTISCGRWKAESGGHRERAREGRGGAGKERQLLVGRCVSGRCWRGLAGGYE
jgi:hypothetical protein